MRLRFERVVRCPQELAFDFIAARDNDVYWWRECEVSYRISPERAEVGERNHQEVRQPPLGRFGHNCEIIEWDRPNRMVERGYDTRTPYVTTYFADPIDGDTTCVGFEAELHVSHPLLRFVAPIVRPLLVRAGERNMDLLVEVLERRVLLDRYGYVPAGG